MVQADSAAQSFLELVLNIEQPHANGGGEQCDRQVYENEGPPADKPCGGQDDEGDGEMKTLEHTEGPCGARRLARGPRDDARHARVDIPSEGGRVGGIGQRDIDVGDVLGAGQRARRAHDVEQIRQVHAHFTWHGAEACGIGRRLVDARDAKRPRPGAGRVCRESHQAADGQALFGRELTRNQDVVGARARRLLRTGH